MHHPAIKIYHRIAPRLMVAVGLVLLIFLAMGAYINIKDQKRRLMESVVTGADRLTNTILLGARYAMMLNSRDDITQIIANVGRQQGMENIRIYNKAGQIKFSNRPTEVDQVTNIEAEACTICHRSDPPPRNLDLADRIRFFHDDRGDRLMGIITPIGNDPSCSTGNCHFHPSDKQILGALDVVVSLKETDREILAIESNTFTFAVLVFLVTSGIILLFVLRFVNHPIKKLIAGTRRIARGDYHTPVDVHRRDEIGHLARAVDHMGRDISRHQAELNKQRDEYQTLFERVPCLITVQDREYRLLRYNHEFARQFDPVPGDYCYHAYKGRDRKCETCPVERTFMDGAGHHAEESGLGKDGTPFYWIVRTSPIRDGEGNIVAAMEISHDITERIEAEQQLIQAGKLATLGEMATGVAHELNQPLSVIKTISSFFMRKLSEATPIDHEILVTMLTKVDHNVDRATRIIDHMRQFARKSEMKLQTVAVNDILQGAFEIFSQQLKVRGITAAWDLGDDLPAITADPQRLEQVFINLLINARDAIEEKWRQRGQPREDDTITLQTRRSPTEIICRVCDTGIGIPASIVSKIFDPFFTTKEVGKGTGLGLSISYGIIKECHGTIRVENHGHQGTCFVMGFPILHPESQGLNTALSPSA